MLEVPAYSEQNLIPAVLANRRGIIRNKAWIHTLYPTDIAALTRRLGHAIDVSRTNATHIND